MSSSRQNGWLVLTRGVNEEIRVGDNVVIKIFRIQPGGVGSDKKVRIGIRAPRDIEVLRDDVGPKRDGRDAPPKDGHSSSELEGSG